jgi:predicted Zn-dependent peptidase
MHNNEKIIDQQHQKTILSNGLTVLSFAKDDVSSIAIEIWVKVGSRYESLPLNGIAHFIEHMNFKGTSKRNAKQIAEEFDAIGGYLNAYTSKEHTVYSAKILKEFLPLAVDMLADIMFNSIYDEQEIEKEKNVVLQELAQTKDNPDETVFECFSAAAFTDQAVGRTILGSEENILSFDKNTVTDFVHKHYIAPKIIISAGGNLDHQQLVKLVTEKFNPFPSQEVIKSEKAIYTGGSKLELDSELAQLHLIIGYEGVTLNSKDYYTLEMLASILGGSISSRLFQEIREKRGLVYSISSFCQYYLDAGVFGIYLSASSQKQQEIISLLSEEIQKITQDITQEEIDRCLAQVKSSLYMSRETADSWVSILASNYSCYGRYIPRDEVWNGYANITIEKLQKLAKEIFTKEKQITLAALGEIKHLPDYQQIHRSLTI